MSLMTSTTTVKLGDRQMVEVAAEIQEAIELAIRAGACREAARIDPDNAVAWQGSAEDQRRLCCAVLNKMTKTTLPAR
jgi:hypothetical protein